MVILTPGFKRTKSKQAFYIESELHFVPGGNDLSLGFRIVYRVIVRYLRGSPVEPSTLVKEVREVFINIFGLDDKHVNIGDPDTENPDEPASICWEVYWDKSDLDLRKVHKCDVALNSIAKRNQVAIEHISTTIMARELSYLQTHEVQL